LQLYNQKSSKNFNLIELLEIKEKGIELDLTLGVGMEGNDYQEQKEQSRNDPTFTPSD